MACTNEQIVEACFEQAEKFIPKRWYSKREMIKDERAFSPFAQGKAFSTIKPSPILLRWIRCRLLTIFLGRYGCVGKNLALSELRFVHHWLCAGRRWKAYD